MEWAAYLRPLVGIVLLWSGFKQVRNPRSAVAKTARKKADGPESLDVPPVIVPEPTKRELLRARMWGAACALTGAALLWLNPVHVRFSPARPVSATAAEPSFVAIARGQAAAFMAKHGTPSVAIAVVADGEGAAFGLGSQSLFSSAPVDEHTLFEIGSITKTFTGLLLAKLAREKQVELGQSIYEFLPAEARLPRGKDVTLKQLATHTAGFPRMPPNFTSPTRLARLFMGGDPYRGYTERELLRAVAKTELESEPGQKNEYSNYGMSLLGWALTKRLGGAYEEVIAREVLAPLGMKDTFIALGDAQKRKLARGYAAASRAGAITIGRPASNWDLPNAFAGAGALRSSAADMLRYLQANMGLTNTPLAEAIALSQAEAFADQSSHSMGLGWIRRKAAAKDPVIIWHNGGTGGYRSFMGFTEDKKYGVVVLSGSARSVDDLGMSILRALRAQPSKPLAMVQAGHE